MRAQLRFAAVVVGMLVTLGSAGADPVCPAQPAQDATAPKITPNLSAGRVAFSANNLTLAARHFRPLAEDGNPVAQRLLGAVLMRGAAANKPEGAEWLRKAAEAHDVDAEYLYGQALMRAEGVAQDDKGAFDWMKRAAQAGNVPAAAGLGYLYFAGRGVKVDVHQALYWTVQAGEHGEPGALSNIAKSYLNGNGLPKDLHKAMFWISTAIQRVPPGQYKMSVGFQQTRYAIAHQLSVEAVKTIEQDSQKWAPGKGSLAEVMADSEKGPGPGGSAANDADMADR